MFAVDSVAPLAPAQILAPARYAVLDCETGFPDQSAIDAALESWKPPKNWKPETVAAKRAEMSEKVAEKSALLDAAPIICVALKTDRGAILFNGMSADTFDVPGWAVMPCGDERGLLLGLRSILDYLAGPETVLVGHNFCSFDAGKSRNAFLRHRLRLPVALAERDQPVFDTMRQIRHFSAELSDERFVSLDTVARVLGIPMPKQVIDGADCPRLHREGRFAEIGTYCCVDVATTERAFLLMTGQSNELE